MSDDDGTVVGFDPKRKKPDRQKKTRPNGEDKEACSNAEASFGEDALAMEFTRQHGENWRYVASWGKWLHWDGTRWEIERTLAVFDLARKICRSAATLEEKAGTADRKSAAKTVAAVENLARSDRVHAMPDDVWDEDLWSLNTPDGVVDLKTGDIRPHVRSDHMTKLAGATPKQGDPQLWKEFLHTATAGDKALQEYLQRVVGYSLTGSVREHALFFMFGLGGNGKTVMIEIIRKLLGDYATTARSESFTLNQHEGHPTDMAALRGARFVSCNEIEDGKRWAEAKICELTGGSEVKARFMRQDEFTFIPQFKLLIAGNHKPGLRNVNEAIRRRFHLIPFTVTIKPEDRNPNLIHELWEQERDEIMAWAVQGCLDWQEQGLNPPKAVTSATEDYLNEQDTVRLWIKNWTVPAPVKTYVKAAFASWQAWNETQGETLFAGRKVFTQKVEAHGFPKKEDKAGYFFIGFRILTDDEIREKDELDATAS